MILEIIISKIMQTIFLLLYLENKKLTLCFHNSLKRIEKKSRLNCSFVYFGCMGRCPSGCVTRYKEVRYPLFFFFFLTCLDFTKIFLVKKSSINEAYRNIQIDSEYTNFYAYLPLRIPNMVFVYEKKLFS
jgi:hypothetical protein